MCELVMTKRFLVTANASVVCIRQGALAGGVSCLCINLWLNIGALTMKRRLPVLPPTSIDGCNKYSMFTANASLSFMTMSANVDNGADGGLFSYVTSSYYSSQNVTEVSAALISQTVINGRRGNGCKLALILL
jgi:hypothetical protein